MRTIIILALIFLGTAVHSQEIRRISYATTIGTGFYMSKPSCTPFVWQVIGNYNFNERLSAGVGTGISLFEKPIVPLFADVKFCIRKPRKFTPFIQCGAGYGIAVSKEANGGIYLNPAAGISYSIYKRMKLFVSVGYELQKLERLRKFDSEIVAVEFSEKLSHNLISVKVGIEF